eukprot:COSAG02_NODE_22400_length_754_cov_0.592366_2_plen_133_part_01
MVVNHYLHGAAYPTGGAAELARRIIPTVVRGGGAVLVNAPVRSIIVDGMGAAAVRLIFLLSARETIMLKCVNPVCGVLTGCCGPDEYSASSCTNVDVFIINWHIHSVCPSQPMSIAILAMHWIRWLLARQLYL